MSRHKLPAAAILAGGLATRLRPLGESGPKVLVNVAGKPFLTYLLELLRTNGIERVVICAGHLANQVVGEFGRGRDFGISVEYSFDGTVLRGTAGALKRASRLLGSEFFVLNGDTYLDCDYSAVHQAFVRANTLGLMCVWENKNLLERSNVLYRGNRILSYNKSKPSKKMMHIDCGLAVLRTEALEAIPDDQPCDLATLYQSLLIDDQLAAFEVSQRYYEVGSPKGLAQAKRFFGAKRTPSERPGAGNSSAQKNQVPTT